MKNKPRLDENLARTLAGRRALERRYKTFEGLSEFLFRLEQEPLPTPTLPPAVFRPRAQPFGQGKVGAHCRSAHQGVAANVHKAKTRAVRVTPSARMRSRPEDQRAHSRKQN